MALEQFRFSPNRGIPLTLCSYAIPDAKPPRTFAGIALALNLFFRLVIRHSVTSISGVLMLDCSARMSNPPETQRLDMPLDKSCPVLTPTEKQYADIMERIERAMMASLQEAIEAASAQTAEAFSEVDGTEPPPLHDYFVSLAHQKLFLMLCGADLDSFEGGDPEIAALALKNSQNISDHYWAKPSVA